MVGNENNKFKRVLWLMVSPLIVGVMLLLVYTGHEVYPFGDRTIAYYDMAQSYVPLYYHTWDVLHGLKSAYFDWNTAMGCSYVDTSGTFLFFPTNLFFLFVSRNNIIYSMSWFLMLKLMFSAGTMTYYTSKHSSKRWIWIIAGTAYATCGYVVQYYTNIFFLDFVILFPLLVLALEQLIASGRKLMYILLLGLLAMAYQQLVIMLVIYLVLKAWLLIRELEVSKRARAVIEFVVSSIAAAMLTGAISIPAALQLMQSDRVTAGSSSRLLAALLAIECDFGYMKLFMLFACELGIAALIFGVALNKDNVKNYLSSEIMMIFLMLPIVFESINILWHGGSYVHFPLRFGYMLAFESIMLFARTIEVVCTEQEKKSEQKKWLTGILIAVTVLIGIVLYVFCNGFRDYGIRDGEAYRGYWLILAIVTALYLAAIVFVKKGYIREGTLAILTVMCVLLQGYSGLNGLIAPEGETAEESRVECEIDAQLVADDITQEDVLNRVKDSDIALNVNYGVILRQSSIGGWVNGINANAQDYLEKLGYSTNFTRLTDGGGTAFTDAILGVERVYSEREISSLLYSEAYGAGNGTIYDCNYILPFAKLIIEDFDKDTDNKFEYQNRLFWSMTSIEEPLLVEYDIAAATPVGVDDNNTYLYELEIPMFEEGELYLYTDGVKGGYIFAVNDQYIGMPYLTDKENLRYKDNFVNGIVDLGGFGEGTVKLDILTGNETLEDVHLGILRKSVLTKGVDAINENLSLQYTAGKSSLSMVVDAKTSGSLLLPIGYSDSWEILVDGHKTAGSTLEDSLILIDMEEGKHEINMNFAPKGLRMSIVISVIGMILMIIICRMPAIKIENEKVSTGIAEAYHMLYKLVVLGLYIIPIICFGISLILSLVKI